MAKRTFIGGAATTTQEEKWRPANVESTDVFTLTLTLESGATIPIAFAATAATVANVTAGLTAAWNANAVCASLAAASDLGTDVDLKAVTAGVPFSVAGTTTDHGGTNTQTLTKTVITANAGPEDFLTDGNYAEGKAPVAGDDVTFISGEVLYNLRQAAVLTGAFIAPLGSTTVFGQPGQRFSITPTSFYFGSTGKAYIDLNAAAIPARVVKTASNRNGQPALDIVGSAITILRVEDGAVGVAVNAGETATITAVELAGGALVLGSGVTLTNFKQSGGASEVGCAGTTITADAGTLTTIGTGAITTMTNNGATVFPNSTGAITTLNQNKGRTDFTTSRAARTVTTTNHVGGDIYEDTSIITHTNKIAPSGSKVRITVKAV